MSLSRTSSLVAVLVALATALSLVGTAHAAPPAAGGVQPGGTVRAAAVGQPPRNYAPPSGSHFAFPNRSKAERLAIRNRVLFTIQAVWGGARDANRLPLSSNGRIRIATWSFNDWTVARALVAAHKRGASVQVIAAKGRNRSEGAWKYLKRQLGTRYYKAGVAGSSERVSFARECGGSCRGRGGTPHAKYFLFDNVGFSHRRSIVFSTSMNLTRMGFKGQWNEAQVVYSPHVFDRFMRVYREARLNRLNSSPYRRYPTGQVTSIFFPLFGANASNDPVMQSLNATRCTGATSGGNSAGRTRIRVIQYAIYDDRGLWLSKKLRSLWNAGCDVQIIYALATRPVLSILRSGSGRGPVPMKQSVIKNRRGEIVKYNHSKWMTITGHYGSSRGAWMTFTGSANWSNVAFTSDEQMELISSYGTARAHLLNFTKTWRQKTSRQPSSTGVGAAMRGLPAGNYIPFGQGAYKYLNPYGD
jgi:hypothetical protein